VCVCVCVCVCVRARGLISISSGTQEGERLLLEAATRVVMKGQQAKRAQCVCSELQTV
jgi:hypothetical protein